MGIAPIFYIVMFCLAMSIVETLPVRREVGPRKPPLAAIGVWLLVAVPSLSQFALPGIYTALHRDSDLIMHHHEWWRPYTSFLVQDGGVAGTAFNLATLAFVAIAAERVWGRLTMLGIFFGCLVVFSVDTFLVAQPPGGGNSGLTFRLATSIVGLALVARPGRRSWLIALAVVADGVLTLLLGDAHGEPMITGLVVGVLVALVQRRRRARAEATAAAPAVRATPVRERA